MRKMSPWFLVFFFSVLALGALVASIGIGNFGDVESELQIFFVQGFSKTTLYVAYFFALCALITSAYASSFSLRHKLAYTWESIERYVTKSTFHFAILSFSSSALVLFALNAPGILSGTFLIDDYEMYGIATQKSVWQLLWTPINEHVVPLFWLELKALFALVGTNAPIFNLPLYGAAILAIGGAGVLLRQLKFSVGTLCMFLVLFASTTVVSHQLYGFYAVAPYFQVLAVFTLSLVCFMRARLHTRFSTLFFILSIILIGMSVLLESGGIWTPLAYALFAIAYRLSESDSTSIASIRGAVQKEKVSLILPFLIVVAYLSYLTAIPYFSQEPFYGPDRLPLSVGTLYELYKVLTAGVLSSFFVPRFGLILSQPRFENIEALWHVAMFVLFSGAVLSAWWAYARGGILARIWGIYFLLLSLGTALLVAIARPSSHSVSFYRDQNLLFPLFFIALFFTVILHEWVRKAQTEIEKTARISIIIALCSVVFASQIVFSFYKDQYLGDIEFNSALIAKLRETVVPALNELSAKSAPLSTPSLGGTYLGSSIYQLPDLSEFSYFLGIHNVSWIPPGKSAATSTSLFAEALRNDERLRMWYLVEGELNETCITEPSSTNKNLLTSGGTAVIAKASDTARASRLHFDLTAVDAPEKIFLSIAFDNNFFATGTRAIIRLDQYTKRTQGDTRRYVCSVNLNDIPAFALSKSVKNISLSVTTKGTYYIAPLTLLQNGETLPVDTQ